MNKPIIELTIIKEDTGYSATGKIGNVCIATQGDTYEELKMMILDAVNLSFEDKGFVYKLDEIQLSYDIHSFFDFYKVINAKALSERIGINQSLLAPYINGIKKPSATQTQKIIKGVQQIGRELSEVNIFS